jgi:putative oxidoreductase
MIEPALGIVVRTTPDLVLFTIRLLLAVVIWPHGAQKVLGWFGGYGFRGTMGFFTKTMGIPAPLAFLAIAAEFIGPVALALGLFGRVAALGIATVMVVAATTSHLSNGFFMNWFGNQKGEGFEFHILAFAIAVAIMIGGSGAFSVDYHLFLRL